MRRSSRGARRTVAAAGLVALLALAGLRLGAAGGARPSRPAGGSAPVSAAWPSPHAIVLPKSVRATMNEAFLRNNVHWDELGEMNTLERMLGTTGPTQLEYMGCLQGRTAGDTLRIEGWVEARDLKQLQMAVDGSCDGVRRYIGAWHTHPYRADLHGRALKERGLSDQDLATFSSGSDRVVVVVWDVDSLDAAIRRPDGTVLHPAPVVVR